MKRRCHCLGNRRCATRRATVKLTPDIVGKRRSPVGIQRREIGIGVTGKFGSNGRASIVAVEIELHTLRKAKVTEVVIVFEVMTQRISCADVRAILGGSQDRRTALPRGGLGREYLASRRVQICRAVRTIAQHKASHHPLTIRRTPLLALFAVA